MLHQGVRVGDMVGAIVTVVEKGEEVGKVKGSVSTSQITGTATMVRRASGSTSEVMVRGLWLMHMLFSLSL